MGLSVDAYRNSSGTQGPFNPAFNTDKSSRSTSAQSGANVSPAQARASSANDASEKASADKPVDMEYVAPPGHGSGCGHCVSQMGKMVPKEQAEALRQSQKKAIFDKVWAHEQAHAAAGKHLAGAPSVHQSADGSASGEVPISIPAVDKTDPDKTMKDADTIVAAAMAPSDPSSQDYNVAAQGRALKGMAQSARSELQQRQLIPGKVPAQENNSTRKDKPDTTAPKPPPENVKKPLLST